MLLAGQQEGIRPVKTSASKSLGWQITTKWVGYSLKYPMGNPHPPQTEGHEEFSACPTRTLRIRITGD